MPIHLLRVFRFTTGENLFKEVEFKVEVKPATSVEPANLRFNDRARDA